MNALPPISFQHWSIQPDNFVDDCQRYGGTTALHRLEHRQRLNTFQIRQLELATVVLLFSFLSVFCSLFLVGALLVIQIGVTETNRMRNTGRWWRTWIREPQNMTEIAYVQRMFVDRHNQLKVD